ncbi:hypothetical protein EV715DRAFT_297719 [Schizophyllum commune]
MDSTEAVNLNKTLIERLQINQQSDRARQQDMEELLQKTLSNLQTTMEDFTTQTKIAIAKQTTDLNMRLDDVLENLRAFTSESQGAMEAALHRSLSELSRHTTSELRSLRNDLEAKYAELKEAIDGAHSGLTKELDSVAKLILQANDAGSSDATVKEDLRLSLKDICARLRTLEILISDSSKTVHPGSTPSPERPLRQSRTLQDELSSLSPIERGPELYNSTALPSAEESSERVIDGVNRPLNGAQADRHHGRAMARTMQPSWTRHIFAKPISPSQLSDEAMSFYFVFARFFCRALRDVAAVHGFLDLADIVTLVRLAGPHFRRWLQSLKARAVNVEIAQVPSRLYLVWTCGLVIFGALMTWVAYYPMGSYLDLPQDLDGRRQRAREALRLGGAPYHWD